MSNIYSLTNDYCFHHIFGQEGNEKITTDLLEALSGNKLKGSLNIMESPAITKDVVKKAFTLPILCYDDETHYDIFMLPYNNMYEMFNFYASTVFSRILDYEKTNKKIITYVIVDFDPKYNENSYETSLTFEETKSHLTMDFQSLRIISIEKFNELNSQNKINNKALANWIKFIQNPDLLENTNFNNDIFKETKEKLDEIKNDEYMNSLAKQRMMYIENAKQIITEKTN